MNKCGGQSPREREIIFCEVIACLRETYIMRALISVSDKTRHVKMNLKIPFLFGDNWHNDGDDTARMLDAHDFPMFNCLLAGESCEID